MVQLQSTSNKKTHKMEKQNQNFAGSWESLPPVMAKNRKTRVDLSKHTLSVLQDKLHFDQMTPVQASTIPLFLTSKDVAVEACTGSGKTLAFVIPITEILLNKKANNRDFQTQKLYRPLAIVISPTRELALQIFQVMEQFAEETWISPVLIVGGNEINKDFELLASQPCHVIVATPGRLDKVLHDKKGLFDFKEFDILVLDEADRLLEMGFQKSLNQILSCLPKQRRTGLFSATQTSQVKELVRAGLRNPVSVKVQVKKTVSSEPNEIQTIPLKLFNSYQIVNAEKKLETLVNFLYTKKPQKAIVYFLTCACVDYFYKILSNIPGLKSFKFLSLHSKIPQTKRNTIFHEFGQNGAGNDDPDNATNTEKKSKNNNTLKKDPTEAAAHKILLCTDVAARGLDFSNVEWIIQYDPPQDPNFYIHRVGRTARMGSRGNAILFLLQNEKDYIDYLKVKRVPVDEFNQEIPQKFTNLTTHIKNEAKVNRELMTKGKLAFVSWIRGYMEHQCTYIFRLDQVDLGQLARGFALLHLPVMPEFRNKKIDFENDPIMESQIPFKDKKKEQDRLSKLERQRKLELALKTNKKELLERAEKLKKKRKVEKAPDTDSLSPTDDLSDEDEDEDEINNDYKLLKKAQQKKISHAHFEEIFDQGPEASSSNEEDQQKSDSKSKNSNVRESTTSDSENDSSNSSESEDEKQNSFGIKQSSKGTSTSIDDDTVKLFLRQSYKKKGRQVKRFGGHSSAPWSKNKEAKELRKEKRQKNRDSRLRKKQQKNQLN